MTPNVEDWLRPALLALSPYYVADPGDAIKLDAMENPYRWDAELTEAWLAHLQTVGLNRYPNAGAEPVKAALRAFMQPPAGSELLVGNGLDEVIQIIILALQGEHNVVLSPEPSFAMYKQTATIVGMDYVGVPLQEDDFSLDMFAMLEAIETYQPALVFLAYPNNPTGNAFDLNDIEDILDNSPGLVAVDEAYAPFAKHSFMQRLAEYPNLLVMRTVSKMGLAGLRLGVVAGHPDWITQLNKARLPYNMNALTQATGEFVLQNPTAIQVLTTQTEQIKTDRQHLYAGLQALADVQVWDSQANFLLFRVPDAAATFENLKAHGILIKNLHGSHPLLDNCLRVTVGTPDENQAFLQALAQFG